MADTFGVGLNSFEIEFVAIGDPGNPADMSGNPNPAGSVPYEYRIGKYEISEQMIEKANALGGLGITKDLRGPDKPATSVSWIEAAKFVNWLNASQGYSPAYKFEDIMSRPPPPSAAVGGFVLWEPSDTGYNPANLFRNKRARYFLPSADEWYKAAYYDSANGVHYKFATGSNSPPVAVASGTEPGTAVYHQSLATGPADVMQAGGLSPYGTMAQGGNVGEWEETAFDLANDDPFAQRAWRGGFWESGALSISASSRGSWPVNNNVNATGFRVASVIPEPLSAAILAIGSVSLLSIRMRRF